MSRIPWKEHAVATRQTLEGSREIIREGSLLEVVRHIADHQLGPGGIRIALPDVRSAPSTWIDQEISGLIRSYRVELL